MFAPPVHAARRPPGGIRRAVAAAVHALTGVVEQALLAP